MRKIDFIKLGRIKVGPAHGDLEVSRCGNFATPHIQVPAEYRRQGWCTRLVGEMYQIAQASGLEILWEDDPRYNGNGWFTSDGQAFADSYRARKGIPIPEFHYVNFRKQPRQIL